MNFASVPSIFVFILLTLFGVANSVSADGITVKGKVIDGVTGKPVTRFVEQGGRVDPKDPTKVEWGFWEKRSGAEIVGGAFQENIDWNAGWRMRILAPGYQPQPVLIGVPAKGEKVVEVTVRMSRGREVAGTIRDHKGKPVADASVFLLAKNQHTTISDGKAGWEPTGEDKSVTKTKTADDGRYAILGAGEDGERLLVSTPALDVWSIPVPVDPNAQCDVRLPEPCRLTIKYNIPGAAAEGEFFLQLLTHENKEPFGVDNIHKPKIANRASQKITNLAPGIYTITRTKELKMDGMTFMSMFDRQGITLKPGGAAEAVFVRDRGQSITGMIEIADRDSFHGIFISVISAEKNADRFPPKFEMVKMEKDGTFKTETILPGDYMLMVEAYAPEVKAAGGFSTGIRRPDVTQSFAVTVPSEGKMKPVTITLKKPAPPKP